MPTRRSNDGRGAIKQHVAKNIAIADRPVRADYTDSANSARLMAWREPYIMGPRNSCVLREALRTCERSESGLDREIIMME